MELDNIHVDIKKFIRDLSKENIKSIHEVGTVKSFSFKIPNLTLFFITSDNITKYMISFGDKCYQEEEFVRLIKMKSFW